MILGFGNSLGTGIVMTLSSDVAPAAYRTKFLGLCRVCSDFGLVLGPLIITIASYMNALSRGMICTALFAVAAFVLFAIYVPRYTDQANKVDINRLILKIKGMFGVERGK
jgi:MFS family permease